MAINNKYKKGKGSLDNGYLNNFDNNFSNKYEKNILKIEKLYGYILILID
jgi:hypothetical protein